jgi:hypothetical protein
VSESAGIPEWVYKRDGRLVPFEADRISQALFAASETLGRPDAFLARELTEGVVHFLAAEAGEKIPTTGQIAELIVKVVRELGQPALSQAYADGNRRRLRSADLPVPSDVRRGDKPRSGATFALHLSATDAPARVVRRCLEEYSLHAVFGRDLAAAHRDGLVTLGGLETPLHLAGCVFDLSGRSEGDGPGWARSRRPGALVQALQEFRQRAGLFLVVDGPEYALSPFGSASDLAKNSGELWAGLEATGLAAVVNLNVARPPRWAEESAEGPLFAERRSLGATASPRAHVEEFRTVLLEQLLQPAFAGRIRVDWHLSDRDFQDNTSRSRLVRLARWALNTPCLSFTFDRENESFALAEGVDRQHPAVLLSVGLHLLRLLEVGGRDDFLSKLGSLARIAVSAAVQKRGFLRRQEEARDRLASGFLLDRARLVVVPVGLEAVVRALAGQGSCAGADGLKLAKQVLASLSASLRQAGLAANLETCVDGACWSAQAAAGGFSAERSSAGAEGSLPRLAAVAGPVAWDPAASATVQVQATGGLHAAAGAGTCALLVRHDQSPAVDDLADLLHFAWQRTELVRLRLVHLPHQQQQLAW